jgi:hypothetical protein
MQSPAHPHLAGASVLSLYAVASMKLVCGAVGGGDAVLVGAFYVVRRKFGR